MAEIIDYKYFLGCPNKEEVKVLFKKLAMQHHPDRGGNHNTFVEMKQEYEYIIKHDINYPISSNIAAKLTDTLRNMSDMFRRQRASDMPSAEDTLEQRAELYFNKQRVHDETYDIIDGILLEKEKKHRNVFFCVIEMNKLEDLKLDHFKYLGWKLQKPITFAHISYQQYVKTKTGW